MITNITYLDAGDGADTVIGTNASEGFAGGAGNDTLSGGGGDDIFYVFGDDGLDQIDGGAGYDIIQGGSTNDTIYVTSNFGNLTSIEAIDGGGGNDDRIIATSGDDILDFSTGPSIANFEKIEMGAGDDIVTGSSGDDNVWGGDGADRYIFNPFEGNDYFNAGTGDGGMMGGWTDVVQLDATADPNADPNNPWTITVNGVEVQYDLASGALDLDPDSAGVITLSDGSTLTFEGLERIEW